MIRVAQVGAGHLLDDARIFARISRSLAAAGYDVHVTASAGGPPPADAHGVQFHPIAVPASIGRRLLRRFRVARIVASIDPQIVHVHEPELLGPVLRACKGRPVIWDVHETYLDVARHHPRLPARVRPFVAWAWDHYERRLVARCAAVVAATDGVAKRYTPMHQSVTVVANYPDLSNYQGLRSPQNAAADALPVAVFTGVLQRTRGLELCIRAVAAAKALGCSVRLEIAGRPITPHYPDELLALATQLGVGDLVRYLGVLSLRDTIDLQLRAQIGVVAHDATPSNSLAWPVKMLEYMAAGLPIIYTDLPSHRELAGAQPIGIACESTVESITDALVALVSDPALREQLGANGAAVALNERNWSVQETRLLALYDAVATGI